MSKSKKTVIETIHPVSVNFWREVRIELGYIKAQLFRGLDIKAAFGTKRLARTVALYCKHQFANIESSETKKLSADLPDLIDRLKYCLYACLEDITGKKNVGLSNFRQIVPYVDKEERARMLCSGFDEPVLMSTYHSMRQRAYEHTENVMVEIHVIIQLIIKEEAEDDGYLPVGEYSENDLA